MTFSFKEYELSSLFFFSFSASSFISSRLSDNYLIFLSFNAIFLFKSSSKLLNLSSFLRKLSFSSSNCCYIFFFSFFNFSISFSNSLVSNMLDLKLYDLLVELVDRKLSSPLSSTEKFLHTFLYFSNSISKDKMVYLYIFYFLSCSSILSTFSLYWIRNVLKRLSFLSKFSYEFFKFFYKSSFSSLFFWIVY